MIFLNKKINDFVMFVLACIFIFSGVVKGIDPLGTSLKIYEYLNLFHLDMLNVYSEVFSVVLCATEMFLGLFLVFRIFRKTSIIILLIIMFVFTLITAILAFDPYSYISDCGCFGEVVNLTNTETFLKNIIILLLVIYCCISEYTIHDIHRIRDKKSNLCFAIYFMFGAFALPVYSLIYLPPKDFLGYNIGTNLIEKKEFNIAEIGGAFVKDSLLNSDKYKFVVINRKPFTVKEKQNLTNVNNYCDKYKIECLILKSYSCEDTLSTYFVDDITLKSLIRDRNGLILIKNGIIKGKWNLRHKIINKKQNNNIIKLIKMQNARFSLYLIVILIYISFPIVYFAFINKT